MVPVPVGALHDHVVRPLEGDRVPNDGLVDVANVPGEDDLFLHPVLLQPQFHAGRTQQVAGVHEPQLHPGAQVHDLAILRRGDVGGHLGRVLHCVQGLHRRPAGPLALLVLPLGVHLLDVGRVLEHHRHQLGGEAGGDNLPLEPLLDQQGDAAGVVNVGVGDDHIVNIVGGKVQHGIVPLVLALLQAAVNEDLPALHLQAVAAAGDGLGRPEKGEFHGVSLPVRALPAGAGARVSQLYLSYPIFPGLHRGFSPFLPNLPPLPPGRPCATMLVEIP